MNLFLRLANFLWFLDFENPSKNKDFMAFQKILVNSAKITFLQCRRTLFTVEERKWIILKFGEVKSHILVKRAFQKQFP